jgi:hypothetical protein
MDNGGISFMMEFINKDNLNENDLRVHLRCGFVVIPVDKYLLQFPTRQFGAINANDQYKQRVWHLIGLLADQCDLMRIREIGGGFMLKNTNQSIAVWDLTIEAKTYIVFGFKAPNTYTPINMSIDKLEQKLRDCLHTPNVS